MKLRNFKEPPFGSLELKAQDPANPLVPHTPGMDKK